MPKGKPLTEQHKRRISEALKKGRPLGISEIPNKYATNDINRLPKAPPDLHQKKYISKDTSNSKPKTPLSIK